MKDKVFGYCVQVIAAAGDGQGVMFAPPDGWGNAPIEMWPCEEMQVLQLGAKVIRRPAVMVIWRREVPPLPDAGDENDRQSSKLDA